MNKKIAARFVTAASVATLLAMLAPALRLPAQAVSARHLSYNPAMIVADDDRGRGEGRGEGEGHEDGDHEHDRG